MIAAAGAADDGVGQAGVAHPDVVEVGAGAVDQAVRLHERVSDADAGPGRRRTGPGVDGDLQGEAVGARAV
ncbi:hypothetical protein, partial [Streptomyces sp. NPDC002343]